MSNPKYDTRYSVVLATNNFVNVPTILQYEKQSIISVDTSNSVLKFAFYNKDGKKIADIIGKKIHWCNVEDPKLTVLSKSVLKETYKINYNGKTVIQVKQKSASDFEILKAELFIPDDKIITISEDCEIQVKTKDGKQIGKSRVIMTNNTFINVPIGVFIQKDGTINIGVFQLPNK